jgi:hypothetical protein
MSARRKTVALLALLPALVIAASAIAAPKGKPKKPVKKPAKETTTEPLEPAPTPADMATDKDKAPDAAPAIAPGPTGGGAGDASTGGGAGGTAGAAGAGGASSDAPAKPADSPADKPSDGPDVDSLRQEYLSLRDELFKSRARANAVASQLYSTRIQVKLTYTTGRYYTPAKSSIRLDGASVYEDATGAIAGDDGVRFDGYIAPGRHLITFRVEAAGKDDDSFSSTTESQIVVKAVAGKDLIVAAKAKDSGDIAYAWKRAERGSYGLGIDVSVKTAKSAEGAAAPAATARPQPKGGKQ